MLCPKHEAMPGGVEGAALCLILVRDHAKHAGKAWLPAGVVLTADPEMFFASMPEIICHIHKVNIKVEIFSAKSLVVIASISLTLRSSYRHTCK